MRALLRTLLFVLLIVAPASAEEIAVKGAVIDLQLLGKGPRPDGAMLRRWVEDSARAVSLYYGGSFPVAKAKVRATLGAGSEVGHGQAFGDEGYVVALELGRGVTEAALRKDWVLTHEMFHLGFPSLPAKLHWLEEGLAVYLEPMARARAGIQTPAEAWSDLVENLPSGLPEKGEGGLDGTERWGRTYYGGALFCLRADLEIRQRTGNQRGFADVVRAIGKAGGTIADFWKIDRFLATGDVATGVPVLRELYGELKDKPVSFDLPKMWKELGIAQRNGAVVFDDRAPLAAERKAITAP